VARISRYSPRIKVQRLPIEAISKASAAQRAGRCGRVAPGVCIRLYSEQNFDARSDFTDPEIQRTNLASVILQMKALDLGDIEDFPFLKSPDQRNIRDGYDTLLEINALEGGGLRADLTSIGRRIARLPLDPRIARMIIAAEEHHALPEVLARIHRALVPGGWHFASYKLGDAEGRDLLGRLHNFPSPEWLIAAYDATGFATHSQETYAGQSSDGTQRDWIDLTVSKP